MVWLYSFKSNPSDWSQIIYCMTKMFNEMIYTVTVDHQELMSEYFHWLLFFLGSSLFKDTELSWGKEFGSSLNFSYIGLQCQWSATKYPPEQLLEVQGTQMQNFPFVRAFLMPSNNNTGSR